MRRAAAPRPFTRHPKKTTAAGPSARVRPMEKGGDGDKAGDHGVERGEGATSGGSATFHASSQETTAAGPSARVRPMEKGGDGGKAGNHGVEKGRRDERRFRDLSRCREDSGP